MPRGEGRHRPRNRRLRARSNVTRHEEALRRGGLRGERYSPAEGRCGLGGEGGAALSRSLCIGAPARLPIPRTGHASNAVSDSDPRVAHADRRRRGAPGGVEADVLVFAVRGPRRARRRRRGARPAGRRAAGPASVDVRRAQRRARAASRSSTRTAGWPRARVGAVRPRQQGTRRRPPAARQRLAWPRGRSRSAGRPSPGSSRTTASPRRSRRGRSSTAPSSAPTTTGRWKTGDRAARDDRAPRPLRARAPARPPRPRGARTSSPPGRTAAATLVNAPANELSPEALAGWAEEIAGRHRAPPLRGARAGGDPRARAWAPSSPSPRGAQAEPRLIVLRYDPPDAGRRAARRARRQGGHLRHGRHLDQAGAPHGGHEGRHVRRRPRSSPGLARSRSSGCRFARSAVVAACENMSGGTRLPAGGHRHGAMNGKTIEITNTDAEGRLVLADALWYARRAGRHAPRRLRDADRRDRDRSRRPLRRPLRQRRRMARPGRRRRQTRSGDHAWGLPIHATLPPVHRLRLRGSEELVRCAARRSPILRRWLPPEVRRRGPVGPPRHRRTGLSRALAAAGLPPRRRRHRVRRAADRRAGTLLCSVNLDLTDEHELLRRTVRDFAVERVAPVAEELDREHRFPYELVAGAGRARADGHDHSGGVRRRRRGHGLLRDRGRGADPRRLVRRDHDRRAPLARARCRSTSSEASEQKREWLPELASGEEARGVRADRARGRLGRRRRSHHGRSSRTASGSSTARRSSSRTPAPTSRRA